MPARVGIWGFYFARNYGDDLMCLQIGTHLQRQGYDVSAFELHPDLAAKYGFRSYEKIDHFVADQDAIVFGGGNLLARRDAWPVGPFAARISRMTAACENHHKPIIGISLGGDGQFEGELLPEVTELIQSRQFITTTVRLRTDIPLLASHGITDVAYYPDILYGAPRFFAIPAHTKDVLGFHLPILGATVRMTHFLQAFCRWKLFSNCRSIVYINAFPGVGGDYIPPSPDTESWPCDDPVLLLAKLGRCQYIVSHKLHVGLTAMAQGAYFLSVQAHPKVRAHLAELGLARNVICPRRVPGVKSRRVQEFFKAAQFLVGCRRIALRKRTQFDALALESQGHLRFLSDRLRHLGCPPGKSSLPIK